MKKLKVAILGVTGAVGQEFLRILEQRRFPIETLKLLASGRSAGKKIDFMGKTYEIEEAKPSSFDGLDLVLSSAGGAVSRSLASSITRAGALMVDNTSAFRMDPEVPLVIPEINPEDISKHKGVIANPNCSTIIMLVPLFPIHKVAGIKRIIAATYQAASGAGAKAMEELETQARDFLAGKKVTPKVLPHQIAFNVFSHNSKIGPDGCCEEETKMVNETKKIFHAPKIQVTATCVRVPVLRAHSEALFVETEKKITPEEARDLLSKASGVKVIDDRDKNYFPMPLEATGQDDVLVGRLRADPSVANGLAMFVSGDQIRKGAALNAVQIAEIAFDIQR
ncbi:MAG: aspartate-semialdehyde dehydrogenase [Candidatus Omnitrophica bacterium]|nr:aspartate-semialdehyde dehydrogenase [Candidatus Omnitrophota bacterium]